MNLSKTRLYAILDAETCIRHAFSIQQVAEAWRDAGICLLQYRDKFNTDEVVLQNAHIIQEIFSDTNATLILNDRIHLLFRTGFQGVHVGQTDSSMQQVRQIAGPDAIVGVSTHNPSQLREANEDAASYVAIGPVYATGTKLSADPVVGLDGVRTARALTWKPLVAIGGITRQNAPEVLTAGADAVAVISGLLPSAGASSSQLTKAAQDFLLALQ